MKKRNVLALLLALMLCVALVGCGGGTTPPANQGETPPATQAPPASGPAPEFIKIGIPNPITGPIAAFGTGTPWAEQLVVDAVNADGGIYIKEYDKKIPLKLFVVDTEGNSTKAAEVTQMLIEQEDVDILLARHTPDTALPVSAMAERYGVPCISMECPNDPWLHGGPYEWVYHSFFALSDLYDVFLGMWEELGYGPGTVVGFMFPNDADGLAWHGYFSEQLVKDGYIVSDPGNYPIMNQDWTSIVNKFKDDGVQIITGCDIAPDFAAFAAQAAQLGFEYEFVTMGRAFLFPADANSLPVEIANGLTQETWWTPSYPYKSSVTGMTCPEIAAAFEAEFNSPWNASLGGKHAGMEIIVDALTRAQSLDPAAIRDAIGATDMTTMIGPIKYNAENHLGFIPIVGTQWVKNAAGTGVEMKLVYPAGFPGLTKDQDMKLPKDLN